MSIQELIDKLEVEKAQHGKDVECCVTWNAPSGQDPDYFLSNRLPDCYIQNDDPEPLLLINFVSDR